MTRLLSGIPIWGWFVIITLLLYAVWNPTGYSLYSMWEFGDAREALPVKLLGTVIVAVLLGLFTWGCWKAIGPIGVVILAAIIALVVWCFQSIGWLDFRNVVFWGWGLPIMLGIILSLGLQWPKLWLSTTSMRNTIPVNHHHPAQTDQSALGGNDNSGHHHNG